MRNPAWPVAEPRTTFCHQTDYSQVFQKSHRTHNPRLLALCKMLSANGLRIPLWVEKLYTLECVSRMALVSRLSKNTFDATRFHFVAPCLLHKPMNTYYVHDWEYTSVYQSVQTSTNTYFDKTSRLIKHTNEREQKYSQIVVRSRH